MADEGLDPRPTRRVHKLSDIDVQEVSIVDRPANQRRYLLLKRDEEQSLIDRIAEGVKARINGFFGGSGEDEGVAKAQTKRENGIDFPAAAYLVVPDPERPSTWKLRIWENLDDKATRAQLGRAAAALGPGGFRGQRVQLTAEQRRAAISGLRRAYQQLGVAPEDRPAVVKEAQTVSDDTQKEQGANVAENEVVTKADMEAAVQKALEQGRAEGKAEAEKAVGDRIAALEKRLNEDRYRAHIEKAQWPGKLEDNVAEMASMAEYLPDEAFAKWRESRDKLAAQINALSGGVFKAVGDDNAQDANKEPTIAEEIAKAKTPADIDRLLSDRQNDAMAFMDRFHQLQARRTAGLEEGV